MELNLVPHLFIKNVQFKLYLMMENRMTPLATFDEIIFENRHKEYGAFQLRQDYKQNLTKGFWFTMFFIATVFSLLWIFRAKSAEIIEKVVTTVTIDLNNILIPPKEIVKPIPAELPKVKMIKFVPPTIVIDSKPVVEYKLPTNEDFNTSAIGPTDVEGPDNTGLIDPPTSVNSNSTPTTPESPPKEDNEVKMTADLMPEYLGGMQELSKYLQFNMKYPNPAMRASIEGKVFVQFVVSKTGKISDVIVLKGIGFGCDEEAKRVVENMPKWKPGVQNGMNVNVRFTLPISFKLE